MTIRPPTLREKRRYFLLRIEPAGNAVDAKTLYYAVAEAVTSLWGDSVAAVIAQAVISCEGGFAIIRCTRGTERELAIAIATVTSCRNACIALRTCTLSGTIESLRERIKSYGKSSGTGALSGQCMFGSSECEIMHCHGARIDVIEKGFKNTHRLFLTRDDVEES